MKLTTRINIWSGMSDTEVSGQVACIVETIKRFANIPCNSAFWDERDGDCALVNGADGRLTYVQVVACKNIESEVQKFCQDLFDRTFEELADENRHGKASVKASRTLRLKLEDCKGINGGMYITSYDEDDRMFEQLNILDVE